MTQKPLFWILLSLGSALCLAFSAFFYTDAFPLLRMDITMSRQQALQAATERAQRLNWVPKDAQTAVRFDTDGQTQTFIELEGGGPEAFSQMLQSGVYQALQWQVRFFKEKQADTTMVFFTPQGAPYGFERHLPEDQAGAALAAAQARSLAESQALRDWGVDLADGHSRFGLAEQSQQTRPSGRVDHTLVYERADQRLGRNGEGRLRLSLSLCGDQLCEFRYFVKIPEAFERRYAEMRSANNSIATTATVVVGLLYGLGAVVGGLIWLGRQRFLLLRPALKWALALALLQAAAGVNAIAGSWFEYDTALSTSSFVAQHMANVVVNFMVLLLLLSVSFVAAESLSRRAFGGQPQFWRLWTLGVVNSPEVLGRTVGGYLWISFDLAFIVVFYYLTQHYLGWWSPLEALVDPNILATPAPWLESVANAAQAGFWEESLFRAVPLAAAALLGDALQQRYHGRLGSRRTWLVVALVLQAVIFGCMHANYAQQPAFARPVELFLPALVWGLVYLRFGLLTGVIFHFGFDLLLMSLPIFMTSAPGLALDRSLVLLAGATPLAVVLWARWRHGARAALSEAALNRGWLSPAPKPVLEAPAALSAAPVSRVWQQAARALPLLGLVGLALWAWASPFRQDGLPLHVQRQQAEALADAALHERGVQLGPQWQRFSAAERVAQDSDTFVWRESGPSVYAKLLGRYLAPPLWRVRYVRFDGDVVERAEQWQVMVQDGGASGAPQVRNVWHDLPESRAGATLSEPAARSLALSRIQSQLGLAASALREVSATASKHPNRGDWNFVFAVDADRPAAQGEARVDVDIAGDEVVRLGRFVFVPEQWQRDERERSVPLKIVQFGIELLLALLSLSLVIRSLVAAAKGQVNLRWLLGTASAVLLAVLLTEANNWQAVAIQLNTSQPLATQVWVMLAAALLGALVQGLVVGLFTSLTRQSMGSATWQTSALGSPGFWARGLGLGAVLAGLGALARRLSPAELPVWAHFDLLNPVSGAVQSLLQAGVNAAFTLSVASAALLLLDALNRGYTRRRGLSLGLVFVLGTALGLGSPSLSSLLSASLLGGLGLVLLYLLVLRFEPLLLLPTLVGVVVLRLLAVGLVGAYPGALPYALLQSVVWLLLAAAWVRQLKAASLDRRPNL